ncbi:hypothetical protein MRX96_027635, partial [Rhipicephalus microplus]
MVRLYLPCAVVFLMLKTTAPSGTDQESNKNVDIARFLSTNEKIWTTNTTATQRRRCQFDLVKNVTNYTVSFTRSDFERRRWEYRDFIGNFSNFHPSNTARMSPPYDTMDVTTARGFYIDTEVVHYQSENYTCAVFFVMGSYA